MKTRKPMSKALAKEKADKIEAISAGQATGMLVDALGRKRMGRPPIYEPAFAEDAKRLCEEDGATDQDLATFFGVNVRTIYKWAEQHLEFGQAIQSAKENADDRVEASLYQKAMGYERSVERATASGNVVTVKEWFPPDTASAIFWLKNRRSQKWKDRWDHNHNHTVTIAGEFESFMRQVHAIPHGPEPLKLESDSSGSHEIPTEYSVVEAQESKTIP